MDEDRLAGLAIASVIVLGLGGFFGFLGYLAYSSHVENMACIQSGKSIVGTNCVKLAGDAP